MHHFTTHTMEAGSHPMARLDPRVKLLAALALLAMVISCGGTTFPLLVSGLCLGLSLTLGVSWKTLALRFSEPLFIAATVLLLKAFFSGKVPIWSVDLHWFQLVAHRD